MGTSNSRNNDTTNSRVFVARVFYTARLDFEEAQQAGRRVVSSCHRKSSAGVGFTWNRGTRGRESLFYQRINNLPCPNPKQNESARGSWRGFLRCCQCALPGISCGIAHNLSTYGVEVVASCTQRIRQGKGNCTFRDRPETFTGWGC